MPDAIIRMLENPTFHWVAAGCVMIGALCGLLSCFTLLRRQSLLGDALAHACLPGVCLAYWGAYALQEAGVPVPDPRGAVVLMAGALAGSLTGALCIHAVTTGTRIKHDAALGLVLSVFFGGGVVLLSAMQSAGAAASGLDKLLFGSAASLVPQNLATFGVVSVLVGGVIVLLFKEFKLVAFDREYAAAAGLPVGRLEILLTVLTATVTAMGLQAVGVVLMAALLVQPAAAARQWTDRLGVMAVLAVVIGAGSGLAGAIVSSLGPRIPTGPAVVLAATAVLAVSLAAAPGRGILWELLRRRRHRRRVARENLLADFHRLAEGTRKAVAAQGSPPTPSVPSAAAAFPSSSPPPAPVAQSVGRLAGVRGLPGREIAAALRDLRRRGLVEPVGSASPAASAPASAKGPPETAALPAEGAGPRPQEWRLTPAGAVEAARIVRRHRLWEMFLARRMDIAPDHVHRDAEQMEHDLPAEVVAELERLAAADPVDPHGRALPGAPELPGR